MPVLILFIVWFLAEIAIFVAIGGNIGIGETILEIILSIVIGSWIIKRTLRSAMTLGMASLVGGGDIISNIIGGVLLIIPGFLTDILGVLALISFPVNILLLILGLGKKINMASFMQRPMNGGMGGHGTGKNPFEEMMKQQQAKQQDNTFVPDKNKVKHEEKNKKSKASSTIIDGEVIKKD